MTADYAAFAATLTASGVISDPWFEGQPRFQPAPVILRQEEQAALYRAAEEMAAAYNELCLLCARQPSLAAGFLGLTPVQQALWCASAPRWHGIARADVFVAAEGLRICELNCDTPTGEAEAVLLNEAVAADFPNLLDPNRELGSRFCAMIDALAGGARSAGLIYPTEMTEDLPMVLLYRRWLEQRGFTVTLGSPFNLRALPGGRAALFDTPCDLFLRHYKTDWWTEREPAWADEEPVPDAGPLGEQLAIILRAALAGTCAVVNPFGAVVPQNKRSMALMWERIDLFPDAAACAIRAYLPETRRLEAMPRAQLAAERERWVLKSDYGCEGDEVLVGAETSPEDWSAALELAVPGRWIAQRRFHAARSADGAFVNHGVFLVGGKAAGLYARVSRAATDRHALSAPVLVEARA